MHQENRRSFVKKSLATSVSISFAGLIRAHGAEGGGATTWNSDETTIETTDSGGTTTWNPDETTSYNTTVVTTTAVFDLSGTAEAASTTITFDATGYGQLANDWAVGSVFKYKLKFFASSVDGQNQPHGNPLTIEASAEFYKIGSNNLHTTDRFGLACTVSDPSNGTISASQVGQLPELIEQTSIAAKIDIKDGNNEIVGYYLLYPKIKINNLQITASPENQTTSATISGRVKFWTDVTKYEKNSSGAFVEITSYDSSTDPDYPGGSDFNDFSVTIYSHVHVSH